MLEEESRNIRCSVVLEIAAVDRKFSGTGVRYIRCCGDGLGPFQEIQGTPESNTTEDVFSVVGAQDLETNA